MEGEAGEERNEVPTSRDRGEGERAVEVPHVKVPTDPRGTEALARRSGGGKTVGAQHVTLSHGSREGEEGKRSAGEQERDEAPTEQGPRGRGTGRGSAAREGSHGSKGN